MIPGSAVLALGHRQTGIGVEDMRGVAPSHPYGESCGAWGGPEPWASQPHMPGSRRGVLREGLPVVALSIARHQASRMAAAGSGGSGGRCYALAVCRSPSTNPRPGRLRPQLPGRAQLCRFDR